MLNNATCSDEYSVHTIKTDVYILGDVPANVKVYRAQWGLSDVDSHFFPNISSCSLRNDCVTNREQMETNFKISNNIETVNLSRIGLKII